MLLVADLRWVIWISAPIFASCDRISLTASQSMIPDIAGGLSPSAGNALVFFLMQSGSLVSAALTGVLLHLSSPSTTFAVLAVGFAISVACMLAVKPNSVAASGLSTGHHLKIVFDNRLLQICVIYALLYTGGVLVSVIGPSFVFKELRGSAIDFGKLESAWSAGSIAGTLLLIPLARAVKMPVLEVVVLVMTAACFALIKVTDLSWSLLAFAVIGTLYNLGRVATEVALQTAVPGAALGRAKGALHSMGVFLGVLLFGYVTYAGEAVSPSSIFVGYAIILIGGAGALIMWRMPTKLTRKRHD